MLALFPSNFVKITNVKVTIVTKVKDYKKKKKLSPTG